MNKRIEDKAGAILAGYAKEPAPAVAMALALAALTSAVKAEREQGKAMVREWRTGRVSHAKTDAID